jgi:arylsulfatase A-like enzyme
MAKQLASVSLNILATEGSDFKKIIAQKYCTTWGHPAILLGNKPHNNIDRSGAA